MIKFNCPACGKKLAVQDEHAGRKARCPAAKKKLEDLVLGKRVTFEFLGAGMYNRVRGIVRVDGLSINEEMERCQISSE